MYMEVTRHLLQTYLRCQLSKGKSMVRHGKSIVITLVEFQTNLKMYMEVTRHLLQTYLHCQLSKLPKALII